MVPIFLVSLPRSGSTLLQRVLATHPDIATAPETWSAIPLVYALRAGVVGAEYNHETLVKAHQETITRLPNGQDDYWPCVAKYLEALYSALSGSREVRYFLDKTPRYALILHELKAIFPAAKFILLWRNPVAAIASRFHSYDNRWRVFNYAIDLHDGLANMVSFARQYQDSSFLLRYEDFVEAPRQYLQKAGRFLEIDPAGFNPEAFAEQTLSGAIGDQSGTKRYSEISRDSMERWKHTLCNPLRRRLARKCVLSLGEDDASFMGYDCREILAELDSLPFSLSMLGSDALRAVFGWAESRLNINLIRGRLKKRPAHHYPLL